MNDYIIGHIRTIVPAAIGAFLTWLSLQLKLPFITDLGPELIPHVTAIVMAIYYALVRALAEKWGWVGSLLGYNKAPAYVAPVAPPPPTA